MVKERIGSTVIYSIDEGDLLWPLCRRRGSDQDHTHIGKVIANHDTPTHLSPFSFLFFSFFSVSILLSAAPMVLCLLHVIILPANRAAKRLCETRLNAHTCIAMESLKNKQNILPITIEKHRLRRKTAAETSTQGING